MEVALLYIATQIGKQGVPLGCQNAEGCKKICNPFLYNVWPSAMKFGMMGAFVRSRSSPILMNFGPVLGITNVPRLISHTFLSQGDKIWHG